jgi:putative SOS response-associated peptidase YedK
MCFYIGIDISRSEHIKLKGKKKKIKDYELNLHQPMASGFDYPLWPVLKPIDHGKDFVPQMMHWEFIPSYIKSLDALLHFRKGGSNPKTGKKDFPHNTLNAIGEEILTKPTYKEAALKRRCLVLASGFFEWRHFTPPGGKDTAYPYFMSLKEQEYFFIAGIYNPWIDEQTGEMVDSFSILTTAANSLLEQVHNNKKRMPVMLPEEEAAEWIRDDISTERIAALAKFQISSDQLNAKTIIKDFRRAVEPREEFNYEELPSLH